MGNSCCGKSKHPGRYEAPSSHHGRGRSSVPFQGNDTTNYTHLRGETSSRANNFANRNPQNTWAPPLRTVFPDSVPKTVIRNTPPKVSSTIYSEPLPASTYTFPKIVTSTFVPSKPVPTYTPPKTVSSTATPPKAVSNVTLPDVVSSHTKVVSTSTPFKRATQTNSSTAFSFEKDLSDTFTPPVVDEVIDTAYDDDRGKFLNLLLTLELTALQVEYNEKLITDHLKKEGMTSKNSDELPLTYDSLPQYKKFYFPLMFYDGWAKVIDDFFGEREEDYKLPPPLKLKVFGTAVSQSRNHMFLYLRGLIPQLNLNNRKFNLANWLVLVQAEANKNGRSVLEDKKQTALGFVTVYERQLNKKKKRRAYEHISLLFSSEPLPILEHDSDEGSLTEVEYVVQVFKSTEILTLLSGKKTLTITPVSYIRPLLRQVETMSSMCYKKGFKMTFLNPTRNFFTTKFRQPSNFRFHGNSDLFNETQRNAVVACFNAVAENNDQNRTVMIQGPPGTGKTHTLVAIVKCLLGNIMEGTPPRILICTQSNGAIDSIVLRLMKSNLKIVRIGNISKMHPQVVDCHFEKLVDKGLKYYEQRDQERKLLTEANVILSTLNSVQLGSMEMFRSAIAHDSVFQGKLKDTKVPPFRCVIIDEAGQCTEPELLLPLAYRTSKLILIGDHQQLPATVISNLAQGKGYGRSMFERFYRNFESNHNLANPVITLQCQYRMRKEICAFPSNHFYDGFLETPFGTGVNEQILLKPYLIFDVTNSREEKTSETAKTSRYNVEEANFVCQLIEAIFANLGYSQIDKVPETLDITIGVITFYRGMKDQLINRLKKLFGGELPIYIDVNTVDGFQGQERDIVILSCVRAFDGSHGSVGFVKSEQRMNVALTRAKSALYVAINADSFLRAPNWSELLADANRRDLVFSLTSRVGKKRLKQMISLN